jgi:hypothetical protein
MTRNRFATLPVQIQTHFGDIGEHGGAGAGRDDQAGRALRRPHRLLEPVRDSD